MISNSATISPKPPASEVFSTESGFSGSFRQNSEGGSPKILVGKSNKSGFWCKSGFIGTLELWKQALEEYVRCFPFQQPPKPPEVGCLQRMKKMIDSHCSPWIEPKEQRPSSTEQAPPLSRKWRNNDTLSGNSRSGVRWLVNEKPTNHSNVQREFPL